MSRDDDLFDLKKRMEDATGITARRQMDELTGESLRRQMADLTGVTALRQMDELTGAGLRRQIDELTGEALRRRMDDLTFVNARRMETALGRSVNEFGDSVRRNMQLLFENAWDKQLRRQFDTIVYKYDDWVEAINRPGPDLAAARALSAGFAAEFAGPARYLAAAMVSATTDAAAAKQFLASPMAEMLGRVSRIRLSQDPEEISIALSEIRADVNRLLTKSAERSTGANWSILSILITLLALLYSEASTRESTQALMDKVDDVGIAVSEGIVLLQDRLAGSAATPAIPCLAVVQIESIVREEPSSDGQRVVAVDAGVRVTIVEEGEGWSRVEYLDLGTDTAVSGWLEDICVLRETETDD